MERLTVTTVIAFCIGMFISGIVSFFVCACIVAGERSDTQKAWEDGYTEGYNDGLNGEESAV